MLTWDRALYEGQRRQDERAFAARQRLIRQVQRDNPSPAKVCWRWLARYRAQLTTRGDRGDPASAVTATQKG